MKKLFLPDDSVANKISYYHLLLLLLSLPFNSFYSHVLLISLALHTMIHFDKKSVKPLFTLSNFLLTAIFFLTLLSTAYTENRPEAFKEWEKQFSILLIPLVFCINALDLKKYRDNLLILFALGCTLSISYLFAHAFYTIHYYQFPVTAIFSSAFINHNFSSPLDLHATFFSMQVAVAFIYLVSLLLRKTTRALTFVYVSCCCLLAAGLVQLSSKSVSFAMILLVIGAVPYFLLKGKKRTRFVTASASLLTIGTIGIYQLENFRERYINDLRNDLSQATDHELTDPRLARWEVAIKLGLESPVIGHGAGSEIDLLKERFFEKKFYRSFLYELNAHNQFISFFIKTGLLGVSVYLMLLIWGFKAALIRNDLMLCTFIVLITVVSFSENFLDVDKGIYFYSVFFSFFMLSGQRKSIGSIHRQTIRGHTSLPAPAES